MTTQQKLTQIGPILLIGISMFLVLLFVLDGSQINRAYAQEATLTVVPTFTPTTTPSATATPSQTPGPEPNQAITNTQIFVGQTCTGYPYEMDSESASHYFYFWGKNDSWYKIETSSDNNLDTRLFLYRSNPQDNPNEPILAENDDQAPGNQDAQIQYQATADSFYWLEVQNVEPGRTGNYCLEVKLSETTPTPSPPPDPCEDNYWFNAACEIQLNETNPVTETEYYNFVPASGQGEDNDFYKVWVKQGESYVCRTFALSANNDTNMILYDQNQNGLGGNDDTQPGERGSKLNVTVNYTGWLYILVGPNTEIAPGNGAKYTYKLECFYENSATTPDGSPKGDACENNDSFDLASACLLQDKVDATNFSRESMNFAGWGGGSRDPDYYKLWAIEGLQYTCKTTNLSPNNDTYMKIFYPENPLTPIGENDNKAANGADLGSLVTIDVSRTGWILVLVEPKMPELYGDGTLYTYNLTCSKDTAPLPVSSGVNTAPVVAATPENPATEEETDVSEEDGDSANEPEVIVVGIKEIPPLAPTPTPTPALNNAAFTLTIYYDQNNNHIVEDGEGVANMPVYIYTGLGSAPLAEVTSGDGKLAIAFSTPSDSVWLVVPYLNTEQQISIRNVQQIRLRIASQ